MNGVLLSDSDESQNFLSFDLRDIVRLLQNEVQDSRWLASGVEALGLNARQLHMLSDNGIMISGQRFLTLVDGIYQTIDGLFEAFRAESILPWLRIRVVDGGAFEIESDEAAILDTIKASFKNVSDIPKI